MSWGLGWKRPSDAFHLSLYYGSEEALDDQTRSSSSSPPSQSSSGSSASQDTNNFKNIPKPGFRIDLDWNAGDDEDQVTLRLQSQVMVALPLPQDTVVLVIQLLQSDDSGQVRPGEEDVNLVAVDMKVVKQREPLKAMAMSRVVGSGQQTDGMSVLTKLLKSNFESCGDHWRTVTVVSHNCGLPVN